MPSEENTDLNVREHLLSLDDIGQPKIVDMRTIKTGVLNSAVVLISKLICMQKGNRPDQPNMGVDIRRRYRFGYESELTMLQNDIEEQIATYLPEFLPVDVQVGIRTNDGEKNIIIISITIRNVMYQLSYDPTNSVFEIFNV